MNWLLWRQYRFTALVTGVCFGLFTLAVLLTGMAMSNSYRDTLHDCTSGGTCDFIGNLLQGYDAVTALVHLTIALPVLLGVLLGATLIARETEHSTQVLSWTQTVTRRSWLVTKTVTVLAATVVAAGAVSALVTWWSGTPNSVYGNRFQGAEFDTQNVAPIAFALFTVALGIAAGTLWRRTLPAVATTILTYVAVRLVVSVYVRPHYTKTITQSFPLGGADPIPSGSLVRNQWLVDPAGHSLGRSLPLPSSCHLGDTPDKGAALSCLNRLGFRNMVAFHPPSQYWQFQWMEAGIFVALAAALVAFAIVYTLRRDA